MEPSEGAPEAETAVVEPPPPPPAAEDAVARAASRRYEALLAVRSKAIRGKGAWYWAHLEPVLVRSPDTGLATACKLRCSLCDAAFTASNPSRTASDHFKRGHCPNFASASTTATAGDPQPISSLPPSSTAPPPPLPLPPPPAPSSRQPPLLSGGKRDLGALAMLEDVVNRLRSPKASPAPALPAPQASAALTHLTDWVIESGGAVSPSALDHPKFRAFLHHVGLQATSSNTHFFSAPRLHSRYLESRSAASSRIRDALFFQLASNGWNPRTTTISLSDNTLINLSLNLPNGTTVFHHSVLATARVPAGYAEEVLWDAVAAASGGVSDRCVGIVADRFNSTALRHLETQHQWLINLPCQHSSFLGLIKDLTRNLPLFQRVTAGCTKLALFFTTHSLARSLLHKYQLQEFHHTHLLRAPSHSGDNVNSLAMLEDVMGSSRPIQLAALDVDYKLLSLEDPTARELEDMIQVSSFWVELDAVISLTNLIKAMALEMESDRPLVGQCLPLWDELRSKVKDWCERYSIEGGPVEQVLDERFKKNYHPAWSAAFVLDPLHLVKDSSGKYLPPFRYLSPEQEMDVDRLITRLVSPEEAHIALMELMKWRSEGLDPHYAQAVQEKQLDQATGKMRMRNPQSSRLVWETCLSDFRSLGKVAVRLIFLHATACGFKCHPSLVRWMSAAHGRARRVVDRAQKMVFVAANAKLERRDFSSEEEMDAKLFTGGADDDVHD